MKIVAVTDEHMNLMFQLVGVETLTIKDPDPEVFEEKFEELFEQEDLGIIIITEQLLMRHRDFLKEFKMKDKPIIVEVPKLIGPLKEEYFENFIKKYIGLAVGNV